MIQRIFFELSFNGTAYHGWQVQKNAHSVQQELENALFKFYKRPIELTGAGRTDTGVHAKQFFAHADFKDVMGEKKESDYEEDLYHLNCLTPFDIAIHRIIPVKNDAHARFDADSRTYQYLIFQKKNPFLFENAYFYTGEVDLNKMNEVGVLLSQYKDFSAFSKTHTQTNNNICNITEMNWAKKGDLIIFTITANRFLRNMVRAIVGTMLGIGSGKNAIESVHDIVKSNKRAQAGFSVPAHGLYLVQVTYPFIQPANEYIF